MEPAPQPHHRSAQQGVDLCLLGSRRFLRLDDGLSLCLDPPESRRKGCCPGAERLSPGSLVMAEKFELRDETPPAKDSAAQRPPEAVEGVVPDKQQRAEIEPNAATDVEASGVHLAAGLDAAGYHPVI